MDLAARLSDAPLTAIPLLFGFGVLTSFTPCIFPMIPITAAIVGGQSVAEGVADGEVVRASRWRPALLTLCYVVGLAAVYSGLGLLAGLTGTMFGTISTNPWLYFAMANLLLLAALSMLDVIPVRLPSAITARAATAGTGGRAVGAFVMGAMSGLVAAPCSAPVMLAVLAWVATTKSAALGFVYLFAFSLGMCALLVVVGVVTGAAGRLPRPGMWMVWVKRGFALVMIGVAQYYLIEMGKLLI